MEIQIGGYAAICAVVRVKHDQSTARASNLTVVVHVDGPSVGAAHPTAYLPHTCLDEFLVSTTGYMYSTINHDI